MNLGHLLDLIERQVVNDTSYVILSFLSFYLLFVTFFLLFFHTIFIETFRNCADIAIVSNTGGARPPLFVEKDNPFLLYYTSLRYQDDTEHPSAAQTAYPLIVR